MFTNKLHNMNELINAAAEDMHSKVNVESFKKPLCSSYAKTATHFLAYAKSQGVEMVKVDGEAEDIATEMVKDYYKNQTSPNWVNVLKQALAIGKAQGVKEMGEFAEWASGKGWYYVSSQKAWFRQSVREDVFRETKTTAELITEFQNREV